MLNKPADDPGPDSPGKADPGVLSWTEELRRVAVAVSKKDRNSVSSRQQLFYVLHWTPDARGFGITVRKGRDPESADELWSIDRALSKPPRFVSDDDRPILRLLWASRSFDTGLRAFGLTPRHGGEALQLMAETGRLCRKDDFLPLLLAAARPATVGWRASGDGRQLPVLLPEPAASLVVPLQAPWYVDLEKHQLGPLQVRGNPAVVARLFSLPPLSATAAALVGEALAESALELPSDPEHARINMRSIIAEPLPVLRLQTLKTHGNRSWREYPANYGGGLFDVALPVFRYADVDVIPDDGRDFSILASGETVHVERRHTLEEQWMDELAATGLEKIAGYVLHTFGRPPDNAFGLAEEGVWPLFMRDELAGLSAAGWQIEFAEDFRHRLLDIEAWDADLVESGGGWFDLDMGIIVEGERLPLAPMLAALFRRDARWLDTGQLAQIADQEMIELVTPGSSLRVRAPAWRLKPLAATLIDLFDGFPGGNSLRLSRFDAPRLAELNDSSRWQFKGQGDVLALAEQLTAAQGIGHIDPPAELGLELRHYQTEGLAWLQFLREHNLAGILADDMGLGKTAQTLAHLLLEKEAGRLDHPALIVLPTSLIFNWKNEAARFAPGLSILSLHGPERKSRFDEITRHDVVLTTYPLLWRDAAELTRHRYHLLILDEAQTVKNARSQGAEVVRKIVARHRLCLTGTPLENHLGELWSQFDFLLPGFLGNNQTFTKYWRTPIEKQGDIQRRNLLARRVRPFILRRKKEDVARELPLKTIIVRKVELVGSQRDLYETVRVAMDEKVREEIASKGFNRSQIVILDALLKLRQVCCDPRLVKAKAAQKIKERAKLDLLMTMLPEQVEEGRRILLFSQFTSMLALIEKELKLLGIAYGILTGDTRDREEQVRRFQAGEVPIFLISLRAGGVGLNLTAADTVIHYDPWWNPAAENQATDRAHRLGQDKPVFVYKLIVAGSIEEKILALQERKAELAERILSADRGVDAKFGRDDIAALFAPLPN
ncbi:MAG TPA: DEAD/DEAH box helicase [Accumulibacter sp.]|uniref:DEAD/DEAH box helicase n=1 Tax=Accumulibacter sp. TaxID=2053492 RepID=UPI002D075FDC|nr:DEAD/DEAH box helicase [Accumulibacter sp.]HMW56419.1 DEAD/DEAH box helicase [Accumulibacter sp.]HNC20531.1 DEAD/DEAH box helicase [Accumulibacter sp.]HNF91978.1 DEAD/DEAH box helicase [Accumulibacter sp.]HNO72425.1 DEAD/DEAH box helicase [Accumulibacter sp.]